MPRRKLDRPLDEESRSAVALLAENPDGCTRAIMLAAGARKPWRASGSRTAFLGGERRPVDYEIIQ
jgi:hypothetical protein